MQPFQREEFNGRKTLLCELLCMARVHGAAARVPGIKEHIHTSFYEIFWIERGEAEWWTGDERHVVGAGQIYVNRPGELHGSVGPALQPCSYYFLHLQPSPDGGLPGLERRESDAVFHVLNAPHPRCFAGSPLIQGCFEALFQEARRPTRLSGAVARAQLHLLLAALVRENQPSASRSPSPALRRVLEHIAGNLENDISMEELAGVAGLSSTQFRVRFRNEMGLTPHAYLTRRRIEAAKRLLGEGENDVSSVSRRLGFRSSQYFATVFRRMEGLTPSQYRHSQQRGGRAA